MQVGLSCHDAVSGKPLLSTAFDLDPAAAGRMKTLGINSSSATDYFWRQITDKVRQSSLQNGAVLAQLQLSCVLYHQNAVTCSRARTDSSGESFPITR